MSHRGIGLRAGGLVGRPGAEGHADERTAAVGSRQDGRRGAEVARAAVDSSPRPARDDPGSTNACSGVPKVEVEPLAPETFAVANPTLIGPTVAVGVVVLLSPLPTKVTDWVPLVPGAV